MLAGLASTNHLSRFAPSAQNIQAALSRVHANNIEWEPLAEIAAKDAAFTHAIFTAVPLEPHDDVQDVTVALGTRLRQIGGNLLHAWLLQIVPVTSDPTFTDTSLMVAECAHHLAIEIRYPRPQEAYLAGLWHGLGRLLPAPELTNYTDRRAGFGNRDESLSAEQQRHHQNEANLAAQLVRQFGASEVVQDAIALHLGLEEQIRSAHPLVRIVWSAVRLAGEDAPPALAAVSRVTGLSEPTLLSLRTDVAFLATTRSAQTEFAVDHVTPVEITHAAAEWSEPGPVGALEVAIPAPGMAPSPVERHLRFLAIQGLMKTAFSDASIEETGARLDAGCRLLFGRRMPLVASRETGGSMQAVPMSGLESIARRFDEMQLALDDEASVLSLAGRTGATTSQFPGTELPGRSTADWQLARWLDARGLLCLPCTFGDAQFVAIFPIDAPLERAAADQPLMAALAGAAAGRVYTHAAQAAADSTLRAGIEGRYREHVRRVVHEVNNPLTVIRSYLDLMGQRLGAALGGGDEIAVMNKELDRVGTLLQTMAKGPMEVVEAPRCQVAELLLELRTLYGEPWFGRRQIELDLRVASGLPAARIPPSVLKQVMINLLRNASEALGRGHKLSVSTAGVVVADGVPSLEVRLIDNGPGISADRLPEVFKPHPSQKPGHQGVGLSICKDLLHQWQGSILCRSQPGSGTSFQIFIPLDPVT